MINLVNHVSKTKKTATILDGKAIAEELKIELKKDIDASGLTPGLAAILIGDNSSSRLYIKLKEKAAAQVGINFHKYLCNSECYQDIDEHELGEMINFLNQDHSTHGIIIQIPLPKEFNQDKVLKLINPKKDVDGFNGGAIIPPTIAAVIELLRATGENLNDKKTLVIGNSDIFINGLEKYLKTELNIADITTEKTIPNDSADYDTIIIALGQAHALKKEQVKAGAVVIDIGINQLDGQTVGDVDPAVAEVAGFLSPVPGGVGPLTVACLLRNTFELAKK
jgi:methylenetetrahydrofolate dehydrogenase (NADP+) / methenyltetrahydrofolate cyclohydrolase